MIFLTLNFNFLAKLNDHSLNPLSPSKMFYHIEEKKSVLLYGSWVVGSHRVSSKGTRTKVESDRLGRCKYLGAVSGAALTVTVLYSLYGFLGGCLGGRLCIHCKLTVVPLFPSGHFMN